MTYDDPTFPSFVFVMGMGIGLSMDKLNDVKFVWRRAATLIFLNLIFQGWYQSWHVETLRIPGVLFRLGWCYGIVGTLCAALPTLSHKKIEEKIEKDPPLKNDTKFSQFWRRSHTRFEIFWNSHLNGQVGLSTPCGFFSRILSRTLRWWQESVSRQVGTCDRVHRSRWHCRWWFLLLLYVGYLTLLVTL